MARSGRASHPITAASERVGSYLDFPDTLDCGQVLDGGSDAFFRQAATLAAPAVPGNQTGLVGYNTVRLHQALAYLIPQQLLDQGQHHRKEVLCH